MRVLSIISARTSSGDGPTTRAGTVFALNVDGPVGAATGVGARGGVVANIAVPAECGVAGIPATAHVAGPAYRHEHMPPPAMESPAGLRRIGPGGSLAAVVAHETVPGLAPEPQISLPRHRAVGGVLGVPRGFE